ncbi:MAG: NADH-quinone oxidoreductase subunit J [Burkholderiales bacterium]|nr:NADH-quinone oxidoreductase subunit J [Anaerolineae bacterium]
MFELNAQSLTFAVFSILTLGGGAGVVYSRNLIHSALYLIVSLFGVSGLFILLSAPFLAAVQVLVYIGAIAILIIFAVMLTQSMTQMRAILNRQAWLSALVMGLMFVLLVVAVIWPVFGTGGSRADIPVSDMVATTRDLGVALVDGNQYVLPFEVASLLLTAAMIGAIVIARDEDPK